MNKILSSDGKESKIWKNLTLELKFKDFAEQICKDYNA